MNEHAGKICPICSQEILEENSVIVCEKCEAAYHQECWEKSGGCPHCTASPADCLLYTSGLRAYHAELGVMVDETLDSLLEDQRNWFEENSGMRVV